MKIIIELETDNDALDHNNTTALYGLSSNFLWSKSDQHGHLYTEIHRILKEAVEKIREQRRRLPCICTALESADKLLDINGNTVGSITVL
jgi:hypothetical protein